MPIKIATIGSRIATANLNTASPPPDQTNKFYLSPAWRALVRRLVKERGRRCQECGKPGYVAGDHTIELQDGGAPLDESNVRLLCGSCHTKKTNRERALRTARKV